MFHINICGFASHTIILSSASNHYENRLIIIQKCDWRLLVRHSRIGRRDLFVCVAILFVRLLTCISLTISNTKLWLDLYWMPVYCSAFFGTIYFVIYWYQYQRSMDYYFMTRIDAMRKWTLMQNERRETKRISCNSGSSSMCIDCQNFRQKSNMNWWIGTCIRIQLFLHGNNRRLCANMIAFPFLESFSGKNVHCRNVWRHSSSTHDRWICRKV